MALNFFIGERVLKPFKISFHLERSVPDFGEELNVVISNEGTEDDATLSDCKIMVLTKVRR